MFEIVSKDGIDINNRENWVAIIGSRNASKEELDIAYKLAQVCVRKGKVIVSGLAEGVDTEAHKGAIDAGGKTIAILSTSKEENIYPKSNKELAEKIINNGGLIHPYKTRSPYEYGKKGLSVFQKRLIERDLIVAKMCSVVVAVKNEPGLIIGGTKWAVQYGKNYNKKVFRLNNNFEFFENPEVENCKIFWIPEFNVNQIKE